MVPIYTGYALPPERPIFKRRSPTAAIVLRSLVVSVIVLGGLASAVADRIAPATAAAAHGTVK
jgi:hypothetical protein